MSDDLVAIAGHAVERARALGADEADAYLLSGIESLVGVRKGEVERLFEAGSRGLSVRVIRDKRTAVCSTSDLRPDAIEQTVRTAVELAAISEPDEFAGLPAKDDLALDVGGGLQLYDEAVESLTVDEMKEAVLRAEQAAFDFDARITNSEGAEYGAERGEVVLVNSAGFSGSYPYTAASISVSVIADEADGKKQSDYWFSAGRLLHRLAPPEDIGRQAAARVVRKLGGRKTATREVPVIWDPVMSARLAGIVAGAASGEALFKRATFLADLEGQQAFSPLVTLVDDPLLPAQLASRPFDGEGVRTRRNVIVSGGTVEVFLFDSYHARRLARRTTGSAARRGDTIGIGTGNIMLEPGDTDPAAMIASVKDGLYLTEMMGFGVNQTTGDYSRGAAGIWIENGELTQPVVEINVSGNLKQMLRDVVAVGNDPQWLGATCAPTIMMSKLMVSGL